MIPLRRRGPSPFGQPPIGVTYGIVSGKGASHTSHKITGVSQFLGSAVKVRITNYDLYVTLVIRFTKHAYMGAISHGHGEEKGEGTARQCPRKGREVRRKLIEEIDDNTAAEDCEPTTSSERRV